MLSDARHSRSVVRYLLHEFLSAEGFPAAAKKAEALPVEDAACMRFFHPLTCTAPTASLAAQWAFFHGHGARGTTCDGCRRARGERRRSS